MYGPTYQTRMCGIVSCILKHNVADYSLIAPWTEYVIFICSVTLTNQLTN
jgi:hypothetical protein